ncbi:Dihydroorotate dehydrogenase, electron transfer subunit, iron-sulfur cluster binding domain protein [Desulfofundulus kuznetsovii DSM 6115]|uniref:Dihydroorotate dehydrogenase, electron transfer subunit, iron-sulfur cluster binding domain protein n=1 Tax=Desulfofundulus kuznetsovii (strain DSM 6115 / VKM B-1805 / 17) TaxID=760568 RepID=A0AAU8PAU7_DESK7|nr:Dihydroorotate dehydrogenase, electron transfer subunit, iron-sulfur cluster binding domain protein [Desulfofundulus kuznetsovii DSM 6115]
MKNPYLPLPMRLVKNFVETEDKLIHTFTLEFLNEEDEKSFQYLPGQFAEVSVFGVGEAPFGIASSPTEPGHLKFSVAKVGVVTTTLHQLPEGTILGVRGPLGNNYPIEEFKGKNLVVIGGGFAFTTLRSLITYILHPDHRGDYGELTVIYGARNPGLLLYKDELAEWEKRSDINLICTIDRPVEGWNGRVGFVPAVTKEVAPSAENAYAVICGPPVMIKFTMPVLEELGFSPERIIMSLENRMKCGIGMCGRCNVGNKYVCKDGPVFTRAQLNQLPNEY